MSDQYYKQYGGLFKKAQSTGDFKMFLFDINDSKKLCKSNPTAFMQNIIRFVDSSTQGLLNLESEMGHKILHRHLENFDGYTAETDKDKVVLCKNQRKGIPHDIYRYDSINPLFWMSDMIVFIINKGSISDETFYEIILKNKAKYIPDYDMHYASGFYETDVWAESYNKFSRIYCIPVLEYLSKQSNKLISSKIHAAEI